MGNFGCISYTSLSISNSQCSTVNLSLWLQKMRLELIKHLIQVSFVMFERCKGSKVKHLSHMYFLTWVLQQPVAVIKSNINQLFTL